jgi:DNA primase large subunit
VLKTLEVGKLRNRPTDEYKNDIQQVLDKYLPLNSDGDVVMEERRKDHISHFVLRLVYCRTEESRHWFLQQEHALFK